MGILTDSMYFDQWKTFCSLKESSIRTYTIELKRFEEYLIYSGYDGELDFNNFYYFIESNDYQPIDKEFIDGYIRYLQEHCSATKHMLYDNIVYLKSFFRVLHDLGLIEHNPIEKYRNPFYERKLVDRSLSEAECKLLLKAAIKMDPFFRQKYLLILLMLTTGLRNREVTHLTRDQIDCMRNVIYVDRGQKKSTATVYMPSSLTAEFQRYFSHDHYKRWEQQGNKTVFFQNDKVLYLHRLNNILKKISREAGITKNISAHTLRHTAAYLMQQAGFDISIIKRQLRHKHLETTLRYLPPLSPDLLDG